MKSAGCGHHSSWHDGKQEGETSITTMMMKGFLTDRGGWRGGKRLGRWIEGVRADLIGRQRKHSQLRARRTENRAGFFAVYVRVVFLGEAARREQREVCSTSCSLHFTPSEKKGFFSGRRVSRSSSKYSAGQAACWSTAVAHSTREDLIGLVAVFA